MEGGKVGELQQSVKLSYMPPPEGSPSNIRINPYTFTINLAAKSLHPHLPYIVRFTILTLVFVPSTNPFDKGDDTAFSIASRSFFILSVNFLISWIAQVLVCTF